MASGRLVFNDDTDNITGGTATVTHFIRNVADPDTNTVVRSTELTGGDLIFNLVQDNILDSTIAFGTPAPGNLRLLDWDVAATGFIDDTVTVTEDEINNVTMILLGRRTLMLQVVSQLLQQKVVVPVERVIHGLFST